MGVDFQITRIIFGFNQHHIAGAVDDQVVDLGRLAIQHKPQVVQQQVVLAVFVMAVQMKCGFPLTLDTCGQVAQLNAQPLFLTGVQQA